MTKEEFVDIVGLDEEAIVFEDWDVFSKGIIGTNEDATRVVYGYHKLVNALKEDYMKQDESLSEADAELMAIEWIDYNTLRSLPYIEEEHRPIIIFEIEETI